MTFERLLTLKRDLTSDPEWRLLLGHTARRRGNKLLSLSTPASREKDMKLLKELRNGAVCGVVSVRQTEKMREQARKNREEEINSRIKAI